MSPDVPPPDAPSTTAVPLLADRYHLLDKLGQGGMGTVFHARDAKLDRHVAVKLLPGGSIHDADAVARFRREAKALARLSHSGIIQAFDSGEDGDKHFLVMEFVEGRSLSKILADKGSLSPTRAADYAHQAALALHHAHQNGLVHRDVKPSNLLVTPEGSVKLLDLGLARFLQDQVGDASLTREGTGMGTPDYAAPEQFRDAHHADARADIYSLGCTLYHLIAGHVPFPGSSLSEKVKAHDTKEAPPLEEACPDMPAGLALVVQRMMAKRPADRFQSMAEVAEALAPHIAGASPSSARIRSSCTWDGSKLATMTATPARSRRLLPAVVGLCALALVLLAVGAVGVGLGWFGGGRQPLAAGTAGPDQLGAAETKPKDQAPVPGTEEPNVLTVSQKPEGSGKYRTISDALSEAKPGQTIRVLDDAIYPETISITQASQYRSLTIEAVRGATLAPAVGKAIVFIRNVPDVAVRGFRLRAEVEGLHLVAVYGTCPGVVLEELEFLPGRVLPFVGVSLENLDLPEDAAPVVVRACHFSKAHIGVQVLGLGLDYKTPQPSRRVRIQDNEIKESQGAAILLRGAIGQIQVVGNRITGASQVGVQLEYLTHETRDLLIANNTTFKTLLSFRHWDDKAKGVLGNDVRICNNLILSPGGTVAMSVDAVDPSRGRGAGDGKAVAERWLFAHNWREEEAAQDAPEIIPPGAKDINKGRIDGISRDPKSPDFLRPDKDSPLATEGAGKEDPSLPAYVGAVPPEGVTPWDWDRTWQARMTKTGDK